VQKYNTRKNPNKTVLYSWYKHAMNNFHNTLQQAIDKAGGVTALARLIGVNRGTIHLYKTDGKCPEWAASAIGRATGVDAELLKTPKENQ
jgi:hypothetical protein